LGCGDVPLPLKLERVIEVDGRQGVATDGDRYYVSGSTALYANDREIHEIYIYSLSGD